jgi:uncharacterized repeat protein (TIGR01451 family)
LASNTATLSVAAPPTITKSFGNSSILQNNTTSLSFHIVNPNPSQALSGIAFTDNLPAGLVVATPSGLSDTCVGTVTTGAGASSVSLSGGSLNAGASCDISLNVTGTSAGVKNNTTGQISSTESGPGATSNTASITVIGPPSIAKSFTPASVPLGAPNSTLSFTITNPNANVALTGVAFSDSLPSGVTVASPSGLSGNCGSTPTATAGSSSVSLSGGSIAAGGSCTFSVNVVGSGVGDHVNTTGTVTSSNAGSGNQATATLTVVAPPTISKAFNPTVILLNGTSTLTITVTNPPANTVAENGVAFTDNLPANLTTTGPVTNTCQGTVTTTLTSVGLSGGTIAPSSSCTVSVSVTSSVAGHYTNTTGPVSSTNGGTGLPSNTATLDVGGADLALLKSGPTSVVPGQNATYTINVTNNGPGSAVNPVVTDALPAGTTFASETHPAGWTCTDPAGGTNGTVSCTISSLASGGTASFTVTLHLNVLTPNGTAIPESASVTSPTFDRDTSNNSATVPASASCDHVLTGNVPGSLAFNGGSWCLSGATVGGGITVSAGSTAVITNSTVYAITASNPAGVTLCGSTARSNVNISGATGFVLIGDPGDDGCAANTLQGSLTVSNGQGGTEVGQNRIYGTVTLTSSAGTGPFADDVGVEVEGNTISGNLNCYSNTPVVTNDHQPNNVSGARNGQCAGF